MNSGLNLWAVAITVAVMTGCGGESDYERALNKSISRQTEIVRALGESTVQMGERLAARQQSIQRQSISPDDFSKPPVAIDDRSEYVCLSTSCQVEASHLETLDVANDSQLLATLKSDKEIEFSPLGSVRISAGMDNYSELASQENREVRFIPSPDRRRKRPRKPTTASPLGDRLDPLFRPRSLVRNPVGTADNIKGGRTTDSDEVQVVLERDSSFPAMFFKAPLPTSQQETTPMRYATQVVGRPVTSSEKVTVRLKPDSWHAVSTVPVTDDPTRVSVLFVKMIELK